MEMEGIVLMYFNRKLLKYYFKYEFICDKKL